MNDPTIGRLRVLIFEAYVDLDSPIDTGIAWRGMVERLKEAIVIAEQHEALYELATKTGHIVRTAPTEEKP